MKSISVLPTWTWSPLAKTVLPDPLPVDERAVGAVQVGDRVVAVGAADLGVVAGDFGVVQLDAVGASRPSRSVGSSSSKRIP